MTVSLRKGETVSLQKGNGLTSVRMGLGWDPVKKKSSGLMGWLSAGGDTGEIDLDASVIVYDAARRPLGTVWFRELKGFGGAIVHSGDNRTGDGDGDDETISIDLTRLPAEARDLVFTVNSFVGQTFDQVENATCRLLDGSKDSEICRYVLSEKGRHTGVVMAKLSRDTSGAWSMTALGLPADGRTVQDMQSFVASRVL